jgi:transcriptional regulator with XRE-family HTH domain
MNEIRRDLGVRIRQIRKSLGLNQRNLGELLGVGVSAVSAYESGGAVPSPESLIIIAQHGEVSIDYLVTGSASERSMPREKNEERIVSSPPMQSCNYEGFKEGFPPDGEGDSPDDGRDVVSANHEQIEMELNKDEFTLVSLFRQLPESKKRDMLVDLAYKVTFEKSKKTHTWF